jgi:DNA-binding transcriptional regulator YiaG
MAARMTGAEVKRLRESLGLRQKDLAERLGVHPMTVSRWERDFVSIPGPAAKLLQLWAAENRARKRTKGD